MKINIKKFTRDEWLKLRNETGVGGSEIGAILGLDKYNPTFKLWARKSGIDKTPDEPNKYTESGRLLESYVAHIWQFYQDDQTEDEFWKAVSQNQVHRKCHKTSFMHISDAHPFLFSNLDRIILDPVRGRGSLEIKTTTSYGMKEEETEIKMSIIMQHQLQMYCSGLKWGEVVIYEMDSRKLRVFRFEYDQGIIDTIIKAAQEFWDKVLETRRLILEGKAYDHLRPDPEATEQYVNYLKSLIEPTTDKTKSIMFGDEEMYLDGLQVNKLKEQIKGLEIECMQYQNKIKDKMIFSEEIVNADTALPEFIMKHHTEAVFSDDPQSKITWKKDSRGYDLFRIGIK